MRKLLFVLALSLFLGEAQAQQSVFVPATTATIAVAGTVAARTRIITGLTGKSIYLTAIALVPVATGVVTLSQGTGTNCGTDTVVLTGVMTFAAGQTLTIGTGNGTVLVLAPATDLCITIATAAAPGFIAYSIF